MFWPRAILPPGAAKIYKKWLAISLHYWYIITQHISSYYFLFCSTGIRFGQMDLSLL
jgi:hypothetical protein